jgi:hypothetical protein
LNQPSTSGACGDGQKPIKAKNYASRERWISRISRLERGRISFCNLDIEVKRPGNAIGTIYGALS